MSQVFQSKLFENQKTKLKKRNSIKLKQSIDYKCSKRKSNIIDNSSQKNIIINNKNSTRYSIKNISDKNDDFTNVDLSKNIMSIKKNPTKTQNMPKNDSNKKIDNHLFNNEDNSININKKNRNQNNMTKVNYKIYAETFCKILNVNPNDRQNMKINLQTFSYCDYLYYILNKKNKIKAKIIDKFASFLENALSVEDVIRRVIDLEIIISLIKAKFGKEFTFGNYIKAWIKKDSEMKKLLENENQRIDNNS